MSVSTTTIENRIALVVLDNPPVNALSHALRDGAYKALEAARDNDDVDAIVIACAGRTFVAGADITEFGKPMQAPDLRALIAMIEAIKKPTVAAIHGTALGGGLELALGCHFRVADRAAKLGLPEVKLGLLPGAGGTVRLPYLVGAQAALGLIVSGTPISAQKAHEFGLVDLIAGDDLVQEAMAFATAKAQQGLAPQPVRDRRDTIEATDLAALEAAAAEFARKARGLHAPLACIEAVRNAATLPFDAALAAERDLFVTLMEGEQSRAQRHLFFAEREATKVPGIGRDITPRDIKRAGVIGAGTMGGGIAMALANGGIPVRLVEMNADALARGLATIEKNYGISVSRGSLTQDAASQRMALFSGSTDYADLGDCDFIVEAVFEDMAVKHEVFARIEAVAKPGAILATNTSYLDVNAIAAATGRARDLVGAHFFSPANVMRLLEIVRAEKTDPEVIASMLALAKRIGKVAVVVGVCHGFVGNRMLAARGAELEALLLEGASPQQIDQVFADFGWPMGPFQMLDLAGLDISWRNRKAQGKTAAIADALCEAGRLGQKTAKGFYRYESGARTPHVDPEVDTLIRETARREGVDRRDITAEEIIERTLYPMINEGAKILEEGIATRASDIDIVWVHGYGFPVAKGGPMFYAQSLGIDQIVATLARWHETTGRAIFAPSSLLVDAARRKLSLADALTRS
ncbi:3-hydroxyacyl-CoA dehydrogenase [Mesorhizobium sp. NBSH29]|uniref:3-hydroxyacyl-CoA dehydrogenase NAD-binding domain-containing protein n=1 Tax=Mesorhizobium sp. NBSH29 TaxID=2654249 RepID=UPI0018968B2E|nr:3-hydroxyacyl-CoA dehydrogenase NAD-binding domain-containing protein [Mesorhizobium sp. NBSH29]QPC86899.1 3-hydroxyacyl-CoA dehydrogenase [Mesorhizobium sp. NBSH29]